MFNIGGLEMLIIFMVALLVFGPEKLPEIMRTVGKAVKTFQTETRKATELIKAGLDEGESKGPSARPKAGVVDRPDGYVEPDPTGDPVGEPSMVQPPNRAEPPQRVEPPMPDYEVRPVVREYEDT